MSVAAAAIFLLCSPVIAGVLMWFACDVIAGIRDWHL